MWAELRENRLDDFAFEVFPKPHKNLAAYWTWNLFTRLARRKPEPPISLLLNDWINLFVGDTTWQYVIDELSSFAVCAMSELLNRQETQARLGIAHPAPQPQGLGTSQPHNLSTNQTVPTEMETPDRIRTAAMPEEARLPLPDVSMPQGMAEGGKPEHTEPQEEDRPLHLAASSANSQNIPDFNIRKFARHKNTLIKMSEMRVIGGRFELMANIVKVIEPMKVVNGKVRGRWPKVFAELSKCGYTTGQPGGLEPGVTLTELGKQTAEKLRDTSNPSTTPS